MEKEVLKDYLASRIITFGKTIDGYSNLYYRTNEDLVDQYLDIDFEGKDVFSVLASGDQVFTSRLLEARKTDAFDSNPLAIYYFYLRLWSIEYKDELYPQILEGNNRWLAALLKKVKPRNTQEQNAMDFFRKHLQNHTRIIQMFYEIYCQPTGRTLYTKASEIKECISPELDYYHLDLFHPFELSKTYDIILASNILEWSNNSPQKLQVAYENLSRLVNAGGIIVCSRIIDRGHKRIAAERELFSASFDYEKSSKGYVYIKRNG